MPARPTPMPPLLPDPTPAGDRLLWARTQAADEVRRLRAAATQPPAERRMLLADLGSRLAAMVSALAGQGVPAPQLAQLRELADALRTVPAASVQELWHRAVTVLETFAAQARPPALPPTGPPAAPPTRRAFWKR